MENLFSDINKIIHKPNKKSTIIANFDFVGHRCEICLEFSHKFLEIKSPFFASIKFCNQCVNLMNDAINAL